MLGILTGTAISKLSEPPTAERVLKLQIPTEDLAATRVEPPLISPDGRQVLILDSGGLTVRRLDSLGSRRISDTLGARFPCWSPDSTAFAFVVGTEILRLPGEALI